MNKKSLAYSGVLLVALVVVSVLLNRGIVQGLVNPGDITLQTDATTYNLGDTITFTASLQFAQEEEATIHRARLLVNGPQPLDIDLPLNEGVFSLTGQAGVSGTLQVIVAFDNVIRFQPTPGTTLPPGTLPDSGQFKGLVDLSKISYTILWTPDPLLQPPPVSGRKTIAGDYTGQLQVEFNPAINDFRVGESNVVDFSIVHNPVKVVTIVSEGEAKVGDPYFIAVAGVDKDGATVTGVTRDDTGESLLTIDKAAEILRRMHGLDTVDFEPATHVGLFNVTAGPAGMREIPVTIHYSDGSSDTFTAELKVVDERSNRNFYLFPGVTYVGLGLVPDDSSIDNLLSMPVSNANPDLAAALDRPVVLADVVEAVYAYDEDAAGNPFFRVNVTDHPCSTPGAACFDPTGGLTPADTLTDLAPFQGMIFKSRASVPVDESGDQTIDVFQTVPVAGFDTPKAVPVKMTVHGPFLRLLDEEGVPLPPVVKELRFGFNLIAPHAREEAPFEEVFRGGLIPADRELVVNAIAFKRAVMPVLSGTGADTRIDAHIVEKWAVATMGDTIEPELSYWTFVATPSGPQGTLERPVITPAGP